MDKLIERLERATGSDRSLDADIYRLDYFPVDKSYMDAFRASAPHYTSSVDAAVTLIPKGWAWKCGTCCISDDAWCVPDYNSPLHGERLRKELGSPVHGGIFDTGIDIDQRPPGRVAIALCIAALKARAAVAEIAFKTQE